MYSLVIVFEMVSSPAFNVLMFIWLLPVAVQFFIPRTAVPPPMMLSEVPVLVQCGVWYTVHSHSSV